MSQNEIKPAQPPSGWLKLGFRLPVYLYRLGLGGFLGKRFLRLHHVGRKSGLPRENVLEVAGYDKESDTYYVVSGYGKQSQWYRNLLAQPAAQIQVGWRRCAVTATPLAPAASGRFMVDYARRHPTAARNLAKVLGVPGGEKPEDYERLGQTVLNAVALKVEREL
ncbi:MAG: nitroreductase family deazaflavin-dependent oxidoreductase [Anaerolineales bacterium]|nr:nitroreductase family deazaflavin-dependent oxidoreductase [Anaerolineales bacterium]